MRQIIGLIEGLGLVMLALVIVVGFIQLMNNWADPFKHWFLFTGDYVAFLGLTAAVLIAGFFLKKMVLWEVRAAFPHKKRRVKK
ncbi:MAG: hypothetical protein V1494_06405 [Candidatus Diapherotrites archaeon]